MECKRLFCKGMRTHHQQQTTQAPLSERHLRTAVTEYVVHYHTERNHQVSATKLITPLPASANDAGPIVSRERLGGILNYYCRAA